MQKFALFDSSYDIKNSTQYTLSIQLSLNGLSFSIYNPESNQHIALKHYKIKEDLLKDDYHKSIRDILKKDVDLNAEYKNVRLLYCSDKNTLIPTPYFDKNLLKKYFEFNHIMDDLDEIHFDKIECINAYNIFTLPNQVAIDLTQQFKNVLFFHHATPFIENHIKNNTSKIGYKVFVKQNPSFFDLMVTKAKDLLLYNSYQHKTIDDIVFFILYVFDKYNISAKGTGLVLQSSIEDKEDLKSSLKTYIENVKHEETSNNFNYSNSFKKSILDQYINLFNLTNCE